MLGDSKIRPPHPPTPLLSAEDHPSATRFGSRVTNASVSRQIWDYRIHKQRTDCGRGEESAPRATRSALQMRSVHGDRKERWGAQERGVPEALAPWTPRVTDPFSQPLIFGILSHVRVRQLLTPLARRPRLMRSAVVTGPSDTLSPELGQETQKTGNAAARGERLTPTDARTLPGRQAEEWRPGCRPPPAEGST